MSGLQDRDPEAVSKQEKAIARSHHPRRLCQPARDHRPRPCLRGCAFL